MQTSKRLNFDEKLPKYCSSGKVTTYFKSTQHSLPIILIITQYFSLVIMKAFSN